MNTIDKAPKAVLVRVQSSQIGEVQHPQHIYPPLPLKHIEALLQKNGYPVRLIDQWTNLITEETLLNKCLSESPGVVVILASPVDRETGFGLARSLKKEDPGIITIAVGQDVTLDCQKYLSEDSPFDLPLPGESGKEVYAVIERIKRGEGIREIKSSYVSSGNIVNPFIVEDLDSLPFPTYSLEELEQYCFSSYPLRMTQKAVWGFLLSSRGCPYDCYFCSPIMRKSYGRKYRTRSAQNVVDEIEHLMKLGVTVISFEDDNLSFKRDHLSSICQEIRRRGLKIKWIAHSRIDELTEEMMVTMKKAGCVLLRLGVESGSPRIIRTLRKTCEEGKWLDRCRKTFQLARRLKIATNALFIIGNPTETREEIESSIRLAKELKPDIIQVHYFTLYPGSAAYADYKNTLAPELISKLHHYKLPVVNLSCVSTEELEKLCSRFYKQLLLRPSFIADHLWHYGPFYLKNPNILFHLSRVAKIL
jgi:radical SAM superfamily enzyme YgiQ (UPF0313 family)